jgi:hypothetical protein
MTSLICRSKGGFDMANTIDWVEIRTEDIEQAARFYESLFGWRITRKEVALGMDVWLFDTGGEPHIHNLRRGGLLVVPKGEPSGIVVYILVDDIEATLSRVAELGGRGVSSRARLSGGYCAYFKDPGGNLLGLYEEESPVQ